MIKLSCNIGDKFGEWTVISPVFSKNKHSYVRCKCSCGSESEIPVYVLKKGKSSKCKKCSARSKTDIFKIGSRFKHWTVIEGPIYKNHTAYYKCRCDCGNEALKLPVELKYKDKDFQCASCAQKENKEQFMLDNGKIGDLNLTIYTHYKISAQKRNIEFAVSIEYLWQLFINQNKRCAITGDPIPNIKKASLDRINSSIGYIEGNVQWVTKQANLSKHIMSMEELYEFCTKVLNHANQQPSLRLTSLKGSETNN